jgi:hypothetical protein
MPTHTDSSTNIVAHVIVDGSNAETDNIHLVLPSLSFDVSGQLLSFDTYTLNLLHGFKIDLTASVDALNHSFQVFSRDIDPGQGLTTDVSNLQFRYVPPATGRLFADFSASTVSSRDGPWNTTTKNPANLRVGFIDTAADPSYGTLGDDFVNYISYAIFNNTQGLDLLDNVRIVVDGTNLKSDQSLDAKLSTFTGVTESTDYDANATVNSNSHPSEVILAQIEYWKPNRLTELDPIDATGLVAGDANWYNNFLRAGDIISFNATVYPAAGQNLTTNVNPSNIALEGTPLRNQIVPRLYTIEVHLV